MNNFHSPLYTPERAIAHLNITGFRATTAVLADTALKDRPFVIAGGTGGRAIAWDVSAAAQKEGISRGMSLAAAQRLVRDLMIIAPDPAVYAKINALLEKTVSRYAPVWQNDGAGNIYLDLTGTRRLFGAASGCVCRIQNEISDSLNIEAAAATATNKLVCKVASRTIRPEGLIEVRAGNEAGFLAHQDIALLPGIGASIMKTIRVTGFRETGELAALTDSEAVSLFGKKGIVLRDSALGIDNSPVAAASVRTIRSRADLSEDVNEETVIYGAIASISGHAGLQMRRERTGACVLKLAVFYADGVIAEGKETFKRPCILDRDISSAAQKIYRKISLRRIRVRSVALSLEELIPLGYEPELFEPEREIKGRKLQEAVDKIQIRYGTGTVMRALVIAANKTGREQLKLTAAG